MRPIASEQDPLRYPLNEPILFEPQNITIVVFCQL
jgi:hypothetical protein